MSMKQAFVLTAAALAVGALFVATRFGGSTSPAPPAYAEEPAVNVPAEHLGVATFGSGCFWCTESDFDKVPGVVSTVSGYMGGTTKNPTYKEVSSGQTGHYEVLQVEFDKRRVGYPTLLNHYWRTTDVVDGGGQFCDRGQHYAPVIFAHTPEQKRLAEEGKAQLDASGRFDQPVAVAIRDASTFTAAEDYHQNYYRKNSGRYQYYRWGCGRDKRIKELWGETVTH